MTPFRTSPHWHALGSATRTPGTVVAQLGVEVRELGSQLQGALGDEPEPAPLEVGAKFEHLAEHREGPRVAALADHPRVLVLDFAPAVADLGQEHGDGLEDVERFEPGGDEGFAVLGRDEAVRSLADHRRHVTGSEEAVQAEIGGFEDGLDRWDDRHVVREDTEVADLAGPRLQQRQRRRRGRRFESDCEEDHRPVRILRRDPQRVERRVHEADVGAFRFGFEQVALAPRDPHHVAKGSEDHPGLFRHGDGIVDPAHGNHADRAARPVDELHGGRQDVFDPVAVDGVGVAAAYLHELEVVVAGQLGDPSHEGPGGDGVPVFVDEAHRGLPSPSAR